NGDSPLFAAALVGLLLQAPATPSRPALSPQSSFAERIASLSEAPGYFDTDNLISNERSYLQVIPDLRAPVLRGGAYIGVGPDQNFSYIATLRPSIAFIIDIRRDNMLLHLLLKALFQVSRTRAEYLALLTGRPVPPQVERWRDASIERLVHYIAVTRVDPAANDKLRVRLKDVISRFGVGLSHEDFETIDRFHRRFIDAGIALQFQSTGRPPQSHYPTYRELLLARDAEGKASNYLALEEAFQTVKALQARDLIIPVVGNLSGPSALAAIGGFMKQRGDTLAALYASNVEFYLFGEGTFRDFAANLRRVPHSNNSLIVRSVFGRWRGPDGSSSQTQSIAAMLDAVQNGRIRSYRELVDY
ncbi:MAG: hypothetical protein WBC51_19305, partial [Vicinamibacterales bacterium]